MAFALFNIERILLFHLFCCRSFWQNVIILLEMAKENFYFMLDEITVMKN